MATLIIGVGKLKEAWQRDACAEYMKRLKRFGTIEIKEVPDQPEPDKPSDALNKRVMEQEGKEILSHVKPGDRVVALCIGGKSYDSEAFAGKIADWTGDGRRLVLIIGGSLGLSDEVIGACSMTAIIPMSGKTESLNAAVASAICLWEAKRGRM